MKQLQFVFSLQTVPFRSKKRSFDLGDFDRSVHSCRWLR